MLTNNSPNVGYAAIVGLCTFLIGVGICRLGYPPLIPDMISQGWVTQAQAGFLGTANLSGYLLGAFGAHYVSKKIEASYLVKISLVVSILGLLLTAFHFNFVWLAFWRFIVGITGAFLIVLTPSFVLKNIPEKSRGKVAGCMFAGVGVGVMLMGFFLPTLAKIHLSLAWLCASLFALLGAAISWKKFSSAQLNVSTTKTSAISIPFPTSIKLLLAAYLLCGIGAVPHTLFLVDYIHKQLDISAAASGIYWSAFGLGSLVGPIFLGFIADKIDSQKILNAAYLLCCLAIMIILFGRIPFLYLLSSFLMGALLPGIAALISARIIDIANLETHSYFWGKMMLVYALSKALSSYLMSLLLQQGGSYKDCFWLAEVAFLLGFLLIFQSKRYPASEKI